MRINFPSEKWEGSFDLLFNILMTELTYKVRPVGKESSVKHFRLKERDRCFEYLPRTNPSGKMVALWNGWTLELASDIAGGKKSASLY